MSPRITRSSARQAASQAARASAASSASTNTLPDISPSTAPSLSLSRKRKVSSAERSPATGSQPSSSVRRSKRQKIPEAAVPPLDTANTLPHPTSPRKGKVLVDMDGTELVGKTVSVGNGVNIHNRIPDIPVTMDTSPSSNVASRRSARTKRSSTQSQGQSLIHLIDVLSMGCNY